MRKCENWLDTYREYTAKAESPDSYHLWCGLSVIAACLRRQVWVNMGHFAVYPNMYVVLVGPPGCRKNSAMNIATNLAFNLEDVKFSADATTREALIKAIANSATTIELDNKEPYVHSSLTIISPELSVFLGTNNTDLLSLLTTLYDCVSTDTEILTNNGWRSIDTIDKDDLALTLNIQTDVLEYMPINFIVKKEAERMVLFQTRAVNQLMSPSHQVLYKSRSGGCLSKDYILKDAEKLVGIGTERHIPLSGILPSEGVGIADEIIALAGWVITDGFIGDSNIGINQRKSKLHKITRLLDSLGIKYSMCLNYKAGTKKLIKDKIVTASEDMYQIYIGKSQPYVSLFGVKHVPSWLKDMNQRQFGIFLNAVIDGDGHHISPTNKNLTVGMNNMQFVDELQALAVKNGWASYATPYKDKSRHAIMMSFNHKKFSCFGGGAKKVRGQFVEGKAQVWCINTDNRTMVIRRKGKVSITGNCHPKWTYRTKNQGTDIIYGEWLNLLGGTTPAWLVGSVPMNAIGGGFTSRIIFVVESEPRHRKAIPRLSKHEKNLQADLTTDLERISMLKGEMSLSDEGERWYVNWYEKGARKTSSDMRFEGYYERKHIHLLKAAMLISASFGDDKIITELQLKSALYIIEQLEEKMVNAFGSAGRSVHAPDIDFMLQCISDLKVVSREQLLKAVWREISPKDIDIVLKTLIDMKHIEQYQDKGIWFYKIVGGKKE